jgi:hypothetical protein
MFFGRLFVHQQLGQWCFVEDNATFFRHLSDSIFSDIASKHLNEDDDF